jgi:hypothetical protein
MKWEFVLSDRFVGPGVHIMDVYKIAKTAGYQFFLFNGNVYFISRRKLPTGVADSEPYEKTSITVDDLV